METKDLQVGFLGKHIAYKWIVLSVTTILVIIAAAISFVRGKEDRAGLAEETSEAISTVAE
jgi:hypothetical protein